VDIPIVFEFAKLIIVIVLKYHLRKLFLLKGHLSKAYTQVKVILQFHWKWEKERNEITRTCIVGWAPVSSDGLLGLFLPM